MSQQAASWRHPAPTVLLPGAGGSAAVCALKSLRLADYPGRIVATDSDPLAIGLRFADSGRIVPPASDPAFVASVLALIAEEGVGVVLPTSGFDTRVYAGLKRQLRDRGVVAAVCDPDAIADTEDKWRFHRRVHETFPLPRTWRPGDSGIAFPCFVKPTQGKGSREATRCDDARALALHLNTGQDVLVQEYLPGPEYSVDVLSDLEANPIVAVPRLRLAIRGGISVKGRVVPDAAIQSLCIAMARFLGLKGSTCMQLKRDGGGQLRFLEVNPRLGGASIFATLAGVNLPLLLVRLACCEDVRAPEFRPITVVRYFEELVVEEGDVE